MIDHVSLAVQDLARADRLYRRMLAPLGLQRLVERPGSIGFGKRYPELWLNLRQNSLVDANDPGAHVCLRAPDEQAVRDFFAAALAGGCTDAGAPGPREGAMTRYYAAFIRDPDGNKLEAATFPRSG